MNLKVTHVRLEDTVMVDDKKVSTYDVSYTLNGASFRVQAQKSGKEVYVFSVQLDKALMHLHDKFTSLKGDRRTILRNELADALAKIIKNMI